MTLEEIRAALQEQLMWMEELRDKLQDLSSPILSDEDARALNDLLSDVRTGPLSDAEPGTLVLYDAHETPYASIDTPQLETALISLIRAEKHRDSAEALGSGVVHQHREQGYPRSAAQSQESHPEDPQGL